MGHRVGSAPLLLLLLLLAFCKGRIVRVPKSPLIRVEGTETVIPCNVTDYDGPSEQNFDWEFSQGTDFVRIVSTWDLSFTSQQYQKRVGSGEIVLRRSSNNAVFLLIKSIQPVDEGEYKCITPSTDATVQGNYDATVQVKVLDVLIATSNMSVTERGSLDLTCNITTDRSGIFQAQVTWYFSESHNDTLSDAQVLLSVDRDSVVSDSPLISLSHVDRNSYHLLMRDVGVEDSGYYFCHAAVWVPQHNGSWHKVVEKTSSLVSVVVTALELDYQIVLNASKTPKFSDDPTELECRIMNAQNTEAKLRFTVSWYYRMHLRSDAVVTDELLAAMDADWTLLVGNKSRERIQNGEIIFSKQAVDTFSLRIKWTSEADRGDYYCIVSAWGWHHNNWVKTKDVISTPVSVFWATQDYTLTVEAVKLKPLFMAGHTFEMTCKVSSQNIKTPRYSVLITAEKTLMDQSNPNGTTRIISLNQDSVVRLEDWTDQTRVDGVVLEKVQENEFRYRMYQTQMSDAGLYRCVVTAWSPGGGGMWREAVNGLSNPIQIDFQTSGPVFNVSMHSDNPTVYQGELADLLCIVTIDRAALEPDDMSFDVSWFAVHSFALDRAPVLLASLDRKGIVSQPRRNWSSDVSLERISPMEFRLRVHGSEDQDFGNHYCSVTPWVRSATGVWQQEPEIKSKPIFISVKMDVLNALKYPLLIGIGLATIIGLLSCLIGYCSSRWCCRKEIQETRRERRRLMSMEMD
ncbi:prostaglandin F2 receptor negative regulator isoform X2 [Gopherus evgoodei]|uniref:prostaglandin F2 receptor negative regulator isoform X2 n=1 Tax=Gopherus evgoodei TaxID=1825980 RepID=UPI0011CFC6B8|nr:prostaglandin F2 receptor negative regulator isoform X2 [Gopherus evgoodei]